MSGHILDLLLWAGVAYFCCMAVAHFLSIKVLILFIYYDTLFCAYQDKIISFAVVAYICLFASAARSADVVVGALVAIWVTVSGLCAVNLSDALQTVLSGRSTAMYWLQTGAIALYALCLTGFWLLSRHPQAT